jgi:hypothetical protein
MPAAAVGRTAPPMSALIISISFGMGRDSPQAVYPGHMEMQNCQQEIRNLTIMGMKSGLTLEKKAFLHDLERSARAELKRHKGNAATRTSGLIQLAITSELSATSAKRLRCNN